MEVDLLHKRHAVILKAIYSRCVGVGEVWGAWDYLLNLLSSLPYQVPPGVPLRQSIPSPRPASKFYY